MHYIWRAVRWLLWVVLMALEILDLPEQIAALPERWAYIEPWITNDNIRFAVLLLFAGLMLVIDGFDIYAWHAGKKLDAKFDKYEKAMEIILEYADASGEEEKLQAFVKKMKRRIHKSKSSENVPR